MKSYKILAFKWLLIMSAMNCNGMFEAILTQLETTFKDSRFVDTKNIKLIRYNRTTFVVNGSFELFVDSIDDFDISCCSYKKGGNEYRLLPYKVGPKNICKILEGKAIFYEDVHPKTINFPPLNSCDFKKGIYYVINYLPNLSQVPPVFQSGDYMIECSVNSGDELVQGFKVYAQLFNIMG